MTELTAEELRQILHYDPETGNLSWIKEGGSGGSLHIGGDHAGGLSRGYVVIWVWDRLYFAHRLAWLYMTGAWPHQEIDHKDGNGANNSWINLRLATRSQNLANQKISAANTSGFKGVCWHKGAGKWMAQIKSHGSRKYLGLFQTAAGAHDAYLMAATACFGEFSRAG